MRTFIFHKSIFILTCLILICCRTTAVANDIFQKIELLDASDENYEENVRKIFVEYENEPDSLVEAAYLFGIENYQSERNDLALFFFKQGAATNSTLDFKCRCGLMIAMTYFQDHQPEKAENELKKFLDSTCEVKWKSIAKIELGIYYENNDDYSSAIQFLKESLPELKKHPSYQFYLIKAYHSLGNNYHLSENIKESIEYYSLCIDSSQRGNQTNFLINCLIARGQAYAENRQYQLAENDFTTAISLSEQHQLDEQFFHAKDQLGLLYMKWAKHDQALQLFNEVLKETNNLNNLRSYSALANKADLLVELNRQVEAIQIYENAFRTFFIKRDIDPESIDFDQQIKDSKFKETILVLVSGYLKIIPGEMQFENRVDSLVTLGELVGVETLNLTNRSSIYDWRNKVKPVYEYALSYFSKLKNTGRCFKLIEQAKAITLLQELQQNYLFAGDGEGSALRKQLLTKEAELETAGDEINKSEILIEIELIKDSIKNYLESKSLSDPLQILTLTEVQSQLNENETLLNYFYGEKNIYYVSVRNNSAEIHQIPVVESEEQNLHHFIATMRAPYRSNLIADMQSKISESWATKLMPVVTEKIIILPDGLLSFLPFETLRKENDFLTRKQFNYGFSAATFFFNQDHKKTNKILAFAPVQYHDDLKLTELNNSLLEVDVLKKFRNKIILHNQATKQELLNNPGQFQLLHISSHASSDQEQNEIPWIATYDEKVYLPEIYNLELNADLVVLSACETNLGKQINGEGVISLSRGFTQAGAKSVIASQWKVNEKSTAEILNYFYTNLKNCENGAEALAHAKQKFIEENPTLAQSPFYWAGLVFYGQNDGITLQKDRANLFYFLGLLLIIGIVLLIKKRLSQNS